MQSEYVQTPSAQGQVMWFDGHKTYVYPQIFNHSQENFINSNMYIQKPLHNTEWTVARDIPYKQSGFNMDKSNELPNVVPTTATKVIYGLKKLYNKLVSLIKIPKNASNPV